jgi:hypothetical protein
MSSGSSIPYRLRPNKAVDRELFLSLLGRLNTTLNLTEYKYIGLGGPFLEDFRLIHARIGVRDMDCIEMEEDVHLRQSFNKPLESISCVHSSLEDYLGRTEFNAPVILWLDYTDPKPLRIQIEAFADQAADLPIGSVIRITLNANPATFGEPPPGREILEWRLEKFKERVADYYPANLEREDVSRKRYGASVLQATSLAVQKRLLGIRGRTVFWALATVYADGQPMATATAVILDPENEATQALIRSWEYFSLPAKPLLLDMPALSTLERLTMEAYADPRSRMKFALPISDMGEDPFNAFKKFYRVFPHFSRVEL